MLFIKKVEVDNLMLNYLKSNKNIIPETNYFIYFPLPFTIPGVDYESIFYIEEFIEPNHYNLLLKYFGFPIYIIYPQADMNCTRCKVIPEEAKKVNSKDSDKYRLLSLKAWRLYNSQFKVDISQFDFFHFHICLDNSIRCHALEYPKDYPANLGHFQKNSNVSMTNFDKRNLMVENGKFKFVKHTPGLSYADCQAKLTIYIDPYTFNVYSLPG
ncbi:hypothetical protein CPAV1605_185 [seawater metagenome]|uniref:Uncharacterized protein n=1 Tax=seawater metagenome TaxID=1561972 RepID=A0A5E8CG89_9ZZZZ